MLKGKKSKNISFQQGFFALSGFEKVTRTFHSQVKLNYCNNLRVSDIALHFGYNEKYLSHLFRQLSGMPLKQFILKSKIDEANYLLTDTNLSIGEIAVKLGYTDAHNFARTYKKCTGLSPSAYREAYAKRLLFHV